MRLIVLATRNEVAALQKAAPSDVAIHCCQRSHDLLQIIERYSDEPIIVAPYDQQGESTANTVKSVRGRFPQATIAAYCTLRSESVREIPHLVRAGVDDLLIQGYDDLTAWLCRQAQLSTWRQASYSVLERMTPDISEDVRAIIAYCVGLAPNVPTVSSAAAALGVSRRTLVNRLTMAGLPSPGELVSWSRLLIAMELLEHTKRSVESVALALGFGSAAGLRKMFRRCTGRRLGDLRLQGGTTRTIELFLHRLNAARHTPRTSVSRDDATELNKPMHRRPPDTTKCNDALRWASH